MQWVRAVLLSYRSGYPLKRASDWEGSDQNIWPTCLHVAFST